MLIILIILSIDKYYIKKLLKMKKKEEILQNLLKNLLDTRLKRLEKRNIEQIKDIKLEKESYNKQGVLLKKTGCFETTVDVKEVFEKIDSKY